MPNCASKNSPAVNPGNWSVVTLLFEPPDFVVSVASEERLYEPLIPNIYFFVEVGLSFFCACICIQVKRQRAIRQSFINQ